MKIDIFYVKTCNIQNRRIFCKIKGKFLKNILKK